MDMDNALPHQPGYQLPCECATCTRWNNDQMIMTMTCAEQRCICDELVNLEVFRGPNTCNGGHGWIAYYRCGRRLCGYNLKAFSQDFEKHKRIIDHAADYLLLHRKVRCGCGALASYDIAYVEELASLQLFFICREKRCAMKYSMLDVITRESRGVRCMCRGKNLQHRVTCELIDHCIYQCPNAATPTMNCGFACHRQDSLTYIHCKQTEEELEESPHTAFPLVAQTVCLKPGRLKFKYDKDYKKGQLGYVCGDKTCKKFITDILWSY